MSFLIGGFSPEQYKSLLPQSPGIKKLSGSRHWISTFNLLRYPAITMMINRVAYFILHRLSVYPNATYLFEKFNGFDFKTLKNEQEIQAAREVFERFKNCQEINQQERLKIGEQLDAVLLKFKKEEEPLPADEPKVAEKTPDNKKESSAEKDSEPKVEPVKTALPQEEILDDRSAQPATTQPKIEEPTLDLEKSNTLRRAEERAEIRKKEPDKGEDGTPLPLVKELEPVKIEEKPKIADSGPVVEEKKAVPLPEAKTEEAEELDDKDDDVTFVDAQDGICLLPEEIEKIVSKPFPLEKNQSIDHLYNPDSKEKLRSYVEDLKKLIVFARQASCNQLLDTRVVYYLNALDVAFQRALELARRESAILHLTELKDEWGILLNEQDEVQCSGKQMDHLIQILISRFPAIYHLAFDLPSFKISQTKQLAAFAREVLVGKEVKADARPCLIRLDEVDKWCNPESGRPTLSVPFDDLDALDEMAKGYVTEWLEGSKHVLRLMDIEFGNRTDLEKVSGWTAQLRESYTAELKKLPEDQLTKEILNPVYSCALIQKLRKRYESEISSEKWNVSQFPAEILEKMFSHAINRDEIKQLIRDSHFENSEDIETLAVKANVKTSLIEPLIRIRIFYILTLLGRRFSEELVKGTKERVALIPKDKEDPDLVCLPNNERIIVFNHPLFNQAEILTTTLIQEKATEHPVAETVSAWKVNSMSRTSVSKDESPLVDVKEISFSVHATKSYRTYLASQVSAQALLESWRELEKLEIVKKCESFSFHERAHENRKPWWWQTKLPFDLKPYQQLEQDKKDLEEAMLCIQKLPFYYETAKLMTQRKQLSRVNMALMNLEIGKLQKSLSNVVTCIEKLYKDENIRKKALELHQASHVKELD